MIFLKIIDSPQGKILILCDEDLYGKEFRNGDCILKITSFYKGKIVEDVDQSILEEANMINAIGKKSLEILVKKNIISKEELKEVKYIEEIPYVFIVKE
ncbi:MAG: DUF424 family protein [Candidatus Aenigmatarchaeota archaeon]